MKKINIISVVLLSLAAMTSCSNFDDINTNPDTTNRVPASMLCTNTILRITKFSGDAKAYIAASALPKYVAYAQEGPMAEQYNKLGAAGFAYYNAWPNIQNMLTYAQGDKFENSYTGVAYFSKAYMLYIMTMQMGDIPASEAGLGEAGFRPKYDTQESVFLTILDYLTEADKAFAAASSEKFAGDPVYDGDVAKWHKAVNSFALKVLMTLSNKESQSSLDIKNRFSSIVNANNLLKDNSDNFNTRFADEPGKYYPLYNSNKFTENTVLSSLLVDALKELNDYRLFYYADPAVAKTQAGISESSMDAYIGVDIEINYNTLNTLHNAKEVSLLNTRYLQKAPEPLSIISYAEQQLIIAEAIELGWISGDSKQYYESGVKAALSFTGASGDSYAHGMPITENYISNYFTGEAAYKSSKEGRLKQIWMQRYLLHFMQDATSSYFEYRRTGFPDFPVDPSTNMNENNKNGIPMRWLYPANETTTNRVNLEDALARQYDGYDEINKIMWLLK